MLVKVIDEALEIADDIHLRETIKPTQINTYQKAR